MMLGHIPDIAFTIEDLDAMRIAREKEATKELGEIRIEVVEVVVGDLNTVNESRATVKKNAAKAEMIIDGYEDLTREELLQRLRDQERESRLQAPPLKARAVSRLREVSSLRGVSSVRKTATISMVPQSTYGERHCSEEEAL